MNTTFEVNSRVVATATAQGLIKGETYVVTKVRKQTRGIFGTFVTYELDNVYDVVNGHFVLRAAN